MFRFFKRTKIEDWELKLLESVITKLPKEYENLVNQLRDGLFKGVLTDVSDIPGYVAFTYRSDILKKYDNERERDFKLTNIKVYDKKSFQFILYEIYVSSGTINGYSLIGGKYNIDVDKVDVSNPIKVLIGQSDYCKIESVLTQDEKNIINPSQVYSILIEDKEYFHIKALEDGDFIGIDKNKKIYKIQHNPLTISLMEIDSDSPLLVFFTNNIKK